MTKTFLPRKQPDRDGPLNSQSQTQRKTRRPSLADFKFLTPKSSKSFVKRASIVGSNGENETWSHKLEYLKHVIWGFDLFFVAIASSLATLWVNVIHTDYASFLSGSKPAITTLGAFYSFALVFRTNICYSRWWEGRVLWGSLIVCTIRLSQQAHLWIKDSAVIDRLSCLSILFAYSCKAQLRGVGIEAEAESGASLVHKGVITREELDLIATQSGWQPFYCIDAMRSTISTGLKAEEVTDEWKMNAAHSALENTICSLSDSIGGCIRVRTTGLPVAYDDILNTVGMIFFTAACLAWAPTAKFYNPVIVSVVYIISKMIICVGSDMEDPFGYDEPDLNLEKFCSDIHKQIIAVDERSKLLTYDLACGPEKLVSHQMNERRSSYQTYSLTSCSSSNRSLSPTTHDDIESGMMPTETDHLINHGEM